VTVLVFESSLEPLAVATAGEGGAMGKRGLADDVEGSLALVIGLSLAVASSLGEAVSTLVTGFSLETATVSSTILALMVLSVLVTTSSIEASLVSMTGSGR
jgi:hypothetical protein